MIKRLKKNHSVLCTSRKYNQVTELAKIRKQKLVIIGKHGGAEKHDKLDASLSRSKLLVKKISKFSPDITLSFARLKQQEFLMVWVSNIFVFLIHLMLKM